MLNLPKPHHLIKFLIIVLFHTQTVLAEPSQKSKCVSEIDSLVKKELKLMKDQTANRSGIAHVILPNNSKEHLLLNKMAISGIEVFTKDQAMLPIEKINFEPEDSKSVTHRLPPIFPLARVKELSTSLEVAQVFGQYQQTVYVFLPIRFLESKGSLTVKFKGESTPLPVLKFPVTFKKNWVDKEEQEFQNKLPDADLVFKLLKNHFCVGIDS